MKKMLSILLALTLVLSFFPMKASASTEQTTDMDLYCPYCQRDGKGDYIGTLVREWWEYGMYSDLLWNTFECYNCGKLWNTVIFEAPHPYGDEPIEEEPMA